MGHEWGISEIAEKADPVHLLGESGARGARFCNSILYVGVLFSSYVKDFKIHAPHAPRGVKMCEGTGILPNRDMPHSCPIDAPLRGHDTAKPAQRRGLRQIETCPTQ